MTSSPTPSARLRALADQRWYSAHGIDSLGQPHPQRAELLAIASDVEALEGERDTYQRLSEKMLDISLDTKHERDALHAAVEAIRDECATNWLGGDDDGNGRYVLVDNVLYRLEEVLGPTIRALGEGGDG